MASEIVHAEIDFGVLARSTKPVPLDRNPVAIYIGSLGSDKSQRTMKHSLGTAVHVLTGCEWFYSFEVLEERILKFPWHALRYQHMQTLRAQLSKRYAPASSNLILTAVKQVINECRKLKLISADDALAATKDVKRVKGSREQKGRALSAIEVAALLKATEPTDREARPLDERDRFLVLLLVNSGVRREEAAELTLQSIRPDGMLLVRGKGNKERLVPINATLAAAIERWKQQRGPSAPNAPLLLRCTREQNLMPGRGLTGGTVFAALRRIAKRANIERLGPHDCRRTFATTLLDKGVDVKTVSRLLGHSSLTTTEKYDRRGERAMREAVELLK